MTSKFSGTVAAFNDILQILVNISAASHFYFLRNTRMSTIWSWWFTALELLKLLRNFLLRDFNFSSKATLWFPAKCPWSRNFPIILCGEGGHRKFISLFCSSRRGRSHCWVAYGSWGLRRGCLLYFNRDIFSTPSTEMYVYVFPAISLLKLTCLCF